MTVEEKNRRKQKNVLSSWLTFNFVHFDTEFGWKKKYNIDKKKSCVILKSTCWYISHEVLSELNMRWG